MLPSAQLLTTPTSHATHKQDDFTYSAKSLISSSFIFLHVDQNKNSKPKEEMQPRPRSRTNDEELWFRMGSHRHNEVEAHEQPRQEQSAYQYTASRHSASRSISPARHALIPVISTSSADRPLPSSPESQRKKHKPASLRNLLPSKGSRRPSHEAIGSAHLQPDSAHLHRRSTSRDGNLSPEPRFPPPPLQAKPRSTSTETYFEPGVPRSARTFPDTTRPATAVPSDPRTGGPRPHTWLSPTEPFNTDNEFHLFAEATSGLPGNFDAMSPDEAPRLQASLFSRGNQNDIIPLPFQEPSALERWQPPLGEYIPRQRPREPSPSQPNLSYRTETNYPPREIVPLPSMEDEWNPQQRPREFETSASAFPGIDSYDQPPFSYSSAPSSSALPRRASYDRPPTSPMPANLVAVNMELERLGVEDEQHNDDELPNYAQSQAEMHEKKRAEAAARARELESRWNSSRSGWRGW
ncbi:hypothetical protein CC80DRAFT_232510 [Byssothecium circinans]|uniref:Uncharacterized protein n=1 Tax=Byssothecium circinans TaxID=147558 RepID=A0A6A5UB76_9PLEO|nr:hypothetical protein CC80DRAFT_232510 [Byssothecium circinans]